MSMLEPEAKLENIKKSIEVFLAAALTGSGLAVDWEGSDFQQGPEAEWIQPRLLPGRRDFHRHTGPDRLGASVTFQLSINIFVRRSGPVSAARLYRLRDLLAGILLPGRDIDLTDFEAGPPVRTGRIRLTDVVTDRAVPVRPADPGQYNLTVQGLFLAQWRP